jgi:hypothetical protein
MHTKIKEVYVFVLTKTSFVEEVLQDMITELVLLSKPALCKPSYLYSTDRFTSLQTDGL